MEEDLKSLISEALAPLANTDPDTLENEIDLIYQVSSKYAKKNNTPREIHIKITKRRTQDKILKEARNEKIVN